VINGAGSWGSDRSVTAKLGQKTWMCDSKAFSTQRSDLSEKNKSCRYPDGFLAGALEADVFIGVSIPGVPKWCAQWRKIRLSLANPIPEISRISKDDVAVIATGRVTTNQINNVLAFLACFVVL